MVHNKFILYPSAPAVQTQLLLGFSGLTGGLGCLLDSSDPGIGGGYSMGESSSGRRQSCFSTRRSGRLYGVFDILDGASGYGYQHA